MPIAKDGFYERAGAVTLPVTAYGIHSYWTLIDKDVRSPPNVYLRLVARISILGGDSVDVREWTSP